jgi:hypothetical protein
MIPMPTLSRTISRTAMRMCLPRIRGERIESRPGSLVLQVNCKRQDRIGLATSTHVSQSRPFEEAIERDALSRYSNVHARLSRALSESGVQLSRRDIELIALLFTSDWRASPAGARDDAGQQSSRYY